MRQGFGMSDDTGMIHTCELKYDFARHELLPFLPDTASALLDVGCGSGAFGRIVRGQRPDIELWAIEPDPVSARAAMDGYDQVLVGEFPDDRIPNSKFDVVMCADVLEHMADPEKALHAAAKAMSSNGVMIASIPNVRNWRVVLWPLLRYGTWTYEETGILDRTHLRFFTRRSMRELFASNGWSVKSVTGINWHRREKLFSAITFRIFDDFLFPQYVVVAHPPATDAKRRSQ